MVCQWRPASEAQWRGTVAAPQPWWWVRREIEEVMGMHSQRQVKANLQRHYLSGRLEGAARDLGSNDVVPPGSRIVVKREPVDADLHKRYCRRVPPTHKQWARMTEKERLDHVLGMTFEDMVYVGDVAAAEAAFAQRPAPVYDDAKQCSACGRQGHDPWECPKKRDKAFVPLARRQLPHGIPRSKLRPAVTDADLDVAYRTAEGELVVLR